MGNGKYYGEAEAGNIYGPTINLCVCIMYGNKTAETEK